MTIQTILYFISILLTFALTGWLAWYAWRHRQLPGSSAYARLALSECLWALAEILSVLSPSAAWALFWFQVRYLFGALIGVFWFVFALEYNGHQDWLSKRLLAGLFILPLITQALLWSNSLHGLWAQRETAFIHKGPFWIADVSARIPGLGYLTHSFYILLLTLAGIALLLLTAWKLRREFITQALLLAGAGLTALFLVINSLFNLLPKMEFNPFTPGLGLSVLLIALAVFRFQFLKRAPAQESAARLTNLAPLEKRSLAIFIFSFILFASGLAAASYLTYQNYEKQFRAQVESQLSAIAALKAEQLQNWRAERLSDANLFYQNKNFAGRVQAYLENPQASETQAGLLADLEKIALFPEYDRVFLLDAQGRERISIPAAPDPEAVPAALVEDAATSLASNEVLFLDFHRHFEKDPIYLSLLVPIFDPQDHQPLGVLVLRINPQVYLDPFIQRWPVPSASAETLLVRREGEQVVYLNQLRFGQETALSLRFPLTDTDLPAVRAALGETGSFEGVDYRGQTVIADLRAVPGSPWFLVSKMDTAEVFAPLRERLWQTLLFFGILILAAGAGLVLAWRQQQVRFYREQVEAAETLRGSEERFRRAVLGAPFPIMIHAEDGEVVTINTPWTELTGYNHSDIPTIADWTQKAYGARMELVRADIDVLYALDGPKAEGEYTIMTRSGQARIWDFSSAPIGRLPDGRRLVISMAMDVTERKKVEAELFESRSILQAAMDNSPAGIAIADAPDGKLRYVNDAGLLIRGGDRQSIVDGVGIDKYVASWQILDLDGRPLNSDEVPLARAILFGETNSREFIVRRASDDDRIVLGNAAPIKDAAGKVVAAIVIFTDITERKLAEAALRESEERLKLAQQSSNTGWWDWDMATGQLKWSRELFGLFGLDPETDRATFEAWDKAMHPDDKTSAYERLDLAVKNETYLDSEYRVIQPGEQIKWIRAMGRASYDTEHKPVRMAGICIDITERKRAEEALRETNEYLDNLFNYANAPIIVWDPQFRITRFNHAFENLTGRSAAEVFGKPLKILFPPAQVRASMELIRKTLTGERWEVVEIGIQHVDGSIRTVLWNSATLFSADGKTPIATIAQGQDITERKQAEETLKENERANTELLEKLNEAQKIALLGSWEWDLITDLVWWSDETYRIFGVTPQDFVPSFEANGKFIHPEDFEKYGQAFEHSLQTGAPLALDLRLVSGAGALKHCHAMGEIVYNEAGQALRFVGTIMDITARKQAEAALRQSEERLRAVLDATPFPIAVVDTQDNNIEFWSRSALTLFGQTAPTTAEWYQLAYPDPDYRSEVIGRWKPALEKARESTQWVNTGEYRVTCRDGSARICELYAAFVADKLVVTFNDITMRKQAEEKLINSETHYRRLFEAARDGILILDAESGVVTDVNAFMVELLGFSHEVFLGKKLWELGFFKDIAANQENYRELLRKDYLRYEDLPLETAQGRKIDVEFVSNVYQVDHHRVVQCNIRDVTARRQAEEALRESEDKFKHVFEYSTVGKSITQFNGGMQVNQALCDLLGYSMEEMQAKKWQEITHPDDIELTQREIETLLSGKKEAVRFVKRFLHKNGAIVWVDLSSSVRRDQQRQPLYLMSSVLDITERKRAEEILQSYSSRLEAQVMERTRELRNTQEQLVRQERLATLGQLAGSIGHELRNPLGVISNAIYYLKMSQPEASEKVREYLEIIEKETRTSDKIVTDLLDFTRIKSVDRESASVSELVRQTLERYPAPPPVQVTLEIPADLPQVYADPQQVVQVLGNLVANACQAMTAARSLEQTKLTISAAVQSDMICIGIQDTGPGIPPENLDKLFQPLFTTKTKGIGLGLAVSQKLVEANGGRIEVESVVGQGSTFSVYLPVFKP